MMYLMVKKMTKTDLQLKEDLILFHNIWKTTLTTHLSSYDKKNSPPPLLSDPSLSSLMNQVS